LQNSPARRSRGYDPPVTRMAPPLLATLIVAGSVWVAANAGNDGSAPRGAVLGSAPIRVAASADAVGDPSGAVLAEMTRRQGTPRRVTREARRRAREFARQLAAARARERARAAAAARRVPTSPSYWFDSQAAAVGSSTPTSTAESAWLQGGRGGWVEASGFARAPANAPDPIKRVIQAGNQIARAPYVWGGGHGAWQDKGYDCSGSVSYALAAGGMLGYSQTSGQLMNWGAPGPGKWLTIYANEQHVFMYVAGLRFDTSGRAGDHASRWQLAPRAADGFVARHYPGL
jgi:cell wall-associated NlpC family hydrolase